MSSRFDVKKVKVRIAVAVDPSGNWSACGWSKSDGNSAENEPMNLAVDDVKNGEARYWIEAKLEVPEEKIIIGTVSGVS